MHTGEQATGGGVAVRDPDPPPPDEPPGSVPAQGGQPPRTRPPADAPPLAQGARRPGRERLLGTVTVIFVVLGLAASAIVQARLGRPPQLVPVSLGQITTGSTAAPSSAPSTTSAPQASASAPPQASSSPASSPQVSSPAVSSPAASSLGAPFAGATPSTGPSAPAGVTAVPQGPTPVAEPVDGVDWTQVAYPMNCYGLGYWVQAVQTGDLLGAGSNGAAVAVACQAGGGTPPSAVYVYRVASAAAASLVQTLLPASRSTGQVTALTAGPTGVTFDTLGYSATAAVEASPDVQAQQHWVWNGTTFVKS